MHAFRLLIPTALFALLTIGHPLVVLAADEKPVTTGETSPPKTPTDPAKAAPPTGTWILQRLGDQLAPTGQEIPELTFTAEGTVTGSTGVNRVNARVGGKDGKLFGLAMITRRAGSPAAMQLEGSFLTALGRATDWRIVDGQLELLAGQDAIARFTHRP